MKTNGSELFSTNSANLSIWINLIVQFRVFRLCHHFQIFDTVIEFVAVLVMHNLVSSQFPTEMLLHDVSMLVHGDTIAFDFSIGTFTVRVILDLHFFPPIGLTHPMRSIPVHILAFVSTSRVSVLQFRYLKNLSAQTYLSVS
jgi:hypothetical protein